MNKNVEGIIIKSSKLWWCKINTKAFRTSPLDGATFPHFIKIKYNVDGNEYIKGKVVYWGKEPINTGDKVVITYNDTKPSKILNIIKK